jgi:hypothetical protein
MGPEQRNSYAQVFSANSAIGFMNQEEYRIAASVRSLERHRELTETSRDRLAQDISRLRSLNGILTMAAGQWLDLAKPLNLKLEDADYAALRKQVPCQMPDQQASV